MQTKSSKKKPLLAILEELSPGSSKNTLRSWVEKKRVFIDGVLARYSHQEVNEGQTVEVGAKTKFLDQDLKILYEDQDIVVIVKPQGLLSVAKENKLEISAHALLKHRYHRRKVFPIHRLDKDTSGLLVFAYTPFAREHLKEQLSKRTMHREYRALVHGHPGKGTWRCHLFEDRGMKVHLCPSNRGKEAITHFETLVKRGNTSYLKLALETGRKHQIRVQAAHAGYPIVGDSKYGLEEDRKKLFQLKAVSLEFVHPRTDKVVRFD